MGGTSASAFSPNTAVSAEDAALYFARYEKLCGVNTQVGGALVRTVRDNAQSPVRWALGKGVLPKAADYEQPITRGTLANALLAISKISANRPAYKKLWFTDVAAKNWFYNDVVYAVQNSLYAGTSATTFSPNDPMTRGMLVTVMHRYAGLIVPKAANPFSDVPSGTWYTQAVIWAAENGIVGGIGGGKFAPNDNVTREQFATILYRYAKDYMGIADTGKTPAELTFADSAGVSSYAREAVKWCVANGIISGKPGNLFDPKGNATRAEVAAMIHRYTSNVG
jgi:hypothetical protein